MWIATAFAVAQLAPFQYVMLLQEDRFVEWLTVGFFVAAAVVHIQRAIGGRRAFDFLIGAFCVFVAGEEFSWGQRLFGYIPPEVFLEHNTQQEFTLHNFADVFGKPKGVLMLALLGYSVVLPSIGLLKKGRALLERVGATPPRVATIPWFVAAVVLLFWYPLELTGEWVEALAGFMFFVAARPTPRRVRTGLATAVLAAALLTAFSSRRTAHPEQIACARRESEALMLDVVEKKAPTSVLLHPEVSIHKRLYSAIIDEYLNGDALQRYRQSACGKSQRYLLDPWGMPYWIRVDHVRPPYRRVQVYSMGPNRRRDSTEDDVAGDDLAAEGVMQ